LQELQKDLQFRAVAYLNVDTPVSGNFALQGSGVPSFRDIVFDATKRVYNPDLAEQAAGRYTVYDTWLKRRQDESTNLPT